MNIKYNNKRNNNKFNQLPSSLIKPIKKKYVKNIDNNIGYNNLNIKNQFNENENIPNEENEEKNNYKENFPKSSIKVKNKFFNYFNNNDRYNNNNTKLKNKNNIIKANNNLLFNNYNRKTSEQIKTPKRLKNDGFYGDKFSFEDSISFLKDRRIFSSGKKDRKNLNLFSPLHKNNYSRNKIANVKQKYNNTHSRLNNKNIISPNYNSNYSFKEDYKYYDLSFNNSHKSLEHYNDRITSVKKLTSSNNKINSDKINYINMNINENIINNPMIIFNNQKIINNNINIKNSDLGEQKKIKLNYNKNKFSNEKKENNNDKNDIEKNFEILLNNKKKPNNLLDNNNNYNIKNPPSNIFLNQNQEYKPNNNQQKKLISYTIGERIIPENIILNKVKNTFNNNDYIQKQIKKENNYINSHQNINPELSLKRINLNMDSFKNIPIIKEYNDNLEKNNEKTQENKNYINPQTKKNNVDITFNDFDASGWIKNYGGVSRPGKDSKGKQKINQDSFISLTNINNINDFNMFGILDGHGPFGHIISKFASNFIPSQIINNNEIKYLSDPDKIYYKLKENNCQIITNAFLACDEKLKNNKFYSINSGTTCTLIIHIEKHIICANVGDSRAIVAYDDLDNDEELEYLETAQLSIDYKPENNGEKKRIINSGGIVEQSFNNYGQKEGIYKVWIKGENYPGLALSRSIGDIKAKKYGVIAEPGITEYDLCQSTKYITICSKGVWKFLSNENVKNLGKKNYLENNSSEFCHKIIDYSVFLWKQNENFIDDITVIVVFLNI